MPTIDCHLRHILSRATDIITDEVLNCSSLAELHAMKFADVHPAFCREAHIQSLLFAGLRPAGYFTLAETTYETPTSPSRRIDLGVWLPDRDARLYLEVEQCGPQAGFQYVLRDARKLIEDRSTNPRDQIRAVFVYGFSGPESREDGFREKYESMGAALEEKGFTRVGINYRKLGVKLFNCLQTGLWALGSSRAPQ